MATPKIVQPTRYKHCVIAPADGGFDVFDGTGRWFHVDTQKRAKWWAAIATRLDNEFGQNARCTPPAPVEDHTPKQAREKSL